MEAGPPMSNLASRPRFATRGVSVRDRLFVSFVIGAALYLAASFVLRTTSAGGHLRSVNFKNFFGTGTSDSNACASLAILSESR